jgi:3-hydroxyacyl-[acyl-carrier-protein] dehydratase
MLQGNFFTINSISHEEHSVKAVLELNPSHDIFKGHFPGTPVVPGVCMLQMVKEVLENILEKETKLKNAAHIKFLTVINPQETTIIQLDLKYSHVENKEASITASLFNDGVVYFKCKGLFSY